MANAPGLRLLTFKPKPQPLQTPLGRLIEDCKLLALVEPFAVESLAEVAAKLAEPFRRVGGVR